MKESLKEAALYRIKALIPFFSSLFLMLVFFVPTHIPLSHFLRPDIGLICVYFWALYCRNVFGLISIILLGAVMDTLSMMPMGLHIAVFVFVYLMAAYFGNLVNTKPFIVSWTSFAVVCFMALGLKTAILSLYYHRMIPFLYVLMIYAASVLIYPLIARINIWLKEKYLTDDEEIYEQG